MKNNLNIDPSERFIFNWLMILEQLLGNKVFKLFLPLKKKLLKKVELNISTKENPKTFQVDEVFEITPEKFQSKYFKQSTPVVIRGAAKEWGCCKKWNLDYFKLGYGEKDILLVNATGLSSREENTNYEFLTVRDLVENIKEGGKKYLRFSPLLENNPDLVLDLDLNWLQKMRGGSTFACTYYMFMGGAGQKTLLHTDQPCNLYTQAYGQKKWTLFSPKDSMLLYPEVSNTAYIKSPIDLDNPNFDKFPMLKHATRYEVVLNPGDVLYVPPHVWHFVENLTDTIAVGYRFTSIRAAIKSSLSATLIRVLSTNPPIWKTMKYGKIDTNLIWAHTGGRIKELMHDYEIRKKENKN
jgi:hypothetical protein